jgi:hypothetical protein
MVKLKFLTSLAFVSIASLAAAQSGETDNREKFQFGLKAGLNYSNVYNTNAEEFRADSKFGLAGGVSASIPISMYLGIQPEVLFSQKGFRASGSLLGSQYDITRTTNYLDFPLQFALKPSEFFTILAGPVYSFLLGQNDDFASSLTSFSHEQEFKNDNIRKNILGFVTGIDLNLKHVVIGSRIGWDIIDNKGDGTSGTPRYKNVWLQGTIGYNFF